MIFFVLIFWTASSVWPLNNVIDSPLSDFLVILIESDIGHSIMSFKRPLKIIVSGNLFGFIRMARKSNKTSLMIFYKGNTSNAVHDTLNEEIHQHTF